MDWEELRPHVFVSERRPNAIPFIFKYFYRPNYGFCLPKTLAATIDSRSSFRAEIDSCFIDDALKCLEVVLPGKTEDAVLVMSNICHPFQVNDSITGVINNLMLIEHFLKHPTRLTLRFGFWPETIGAQAYFFKYLDSLGAFKWGIFTEMLGTDGPHALQFTRQEATLIDRAAEAALERRCGGDFHSGRYTTVLRNDERISNGVNIDIPTISLSRYPYDEYHTSDDTPEILSFEKMRESFEITREIIEALDRDAPDISADTFILPRALFGQPFLTRYNLFYDQTASGAERNLNKVMEDVFSYSDGRVSLGDIADRFGYEFDDVRVCAKGLVEKGLFSARSPRRS
jgi:aminopeptidase-like protein